MLATRKRFERDIDVYIELVVKALIYGFIIYLCTVFVVGLVYKFQRNFDSAVENCVKTTEMSEKTCKFLAK